MDLLTRFFLLALAAGLQMAAPAVESGFTSLFNGKDFTGWKISGPAESFTIQDGAIVANSGHFNVELDLDGLARISSARSYVRDMVEEFVVKGRRIMVLQYCPPSEASVKRR